jgi:hypothetical protein
LEVINSLKNGSLPRYTSVLKEIHLCCPSFTDVKFIHEGRASNIHAHN